MRALALVALGIAAYLGWHAWHVTAVAGCGGGEIWDCDHVLTSHWSKWLGIPVSIPAAALYATLLPSLFVISSRRAAQQQQGVWAIVTTLCVAAGAAAIWFIALQVFVLGHLCKYCVVAHLCGLTLCGFILWTRPLGNALTSRFAALGMAGLLVLVCGQVLVEPAATHEMEYQDEFALEEGSQLEAEFSDAIGEDDLFGAPNDGDFGTPSTLAENNALGTTPPAVLPPHPAVNDQVKITEKPQPSLSPIPQADSTPDDSSPDDSSPDDASPSDGTPVAKAGSDPKDKPPLEEQKLVSILSGRAKINVHDWPVVGSIDAPHFVVELFDYTCPHCRSMNEQLKVARDRYGSQLSIVALPVPLDRDCNDAVVNTSAKHQHACEIARIAIAVWRINPEVFTHYHNWLFEPAHGRTPKEAHAYAAQLVGQEVLNKQLAHPIVNKFIAKHVLMYKRAGKGTIPKLMFPQSTLKGQTSSAEKLCQILERELGVAPKGQ